MKVHVHVPIISLSVDIIKLEKKLIINYRIISQRGGEYSGVYIP